MALEKKYLRQACKLFLKEAAITSPNFKRLTEDDWRRLKRYINKLTTEEMVALAFGEKALQEKEWTKYAGLGLAGAAVGRHFGKGKVGKPGILGAAAAMGGYYLYKKLTDRCAGMNTPQQQASCRAAAAQRVISQLKQNMKDCNSSATPENCSLRIQSQLDKWQKIYSDQSVKAHGVG
jgi:hypothetical protein